MKEFTIIIEKDEEGFFVGEVVELPGCHSQAKTIESLKERMREAIELWLEESKYNIPTNTFVKIEKIAL